MTIVTRFAPSPTGRLHIGHAYAALFAYRRAREAGGRFLLRIEDIDLERCTQEFEKGIYEDLSWLGLSWEKPVRRQSDHFNDYAAALRKLQALDLLYPCFCTRKDIALEIARSGAAPHGPEGHLYPGICRTMSDLQRTHKIATGLPYAFRLDMGKAISHLRDNGKWPLTWFDHEKGEVTATPEILGDVVLARKDVNTSYHLSVTLDDHWQGVTLVTRGEDLFYATHLHRMLQELLGLDVPQWHHHKLLLDKEGKKFSKRDNAVTLQHLREVEKKTPQDLLNMIGLCFALVFICLGVFLTAAPASASTIQTSAESRLENIDKKRFFSLALENDSLASGGDRNYTNGARLSYFNINSKIPPFIDEIADHVPGFDINRTTSIFWSLGQNLYTPADITQAEENVRDRPWAAWLYASTGLATVTDNHIDELELTLGIVGPAAQGEEVQKFVHRRLNADDPRGWDNQIHNEPGLMVSWRRRWPEIAGADFAGFHLGAEPEIDITLGNVYTYAGTGMTLRLGPATDLWQDTPPRVRPAIPGTGYFERPEDNFGWYLFTGIEGRAVGRNIFLDGNTFRNSPSIDKKPFVGDISAGAALIWRDLRLSYSLTYRTKEFYGQDDSDAFGALSLSFRY